MHGGWEEPREEAVGEVCPHLVHHPGDPAVLVLDHSHPHGQDVAAGVKGGEAAAVTEGVREDVLVNEVHPLNTKGPAHRRGREEVCPEEVHHVRVHVGRDHLELDALLLVL